MPVNPDLPPVRACLFDMDGLLIDSEDAYTRVTNTILRENGRPDLPWTVKAQLQGRPGPESHRLFFDWAQLRIDKETFLKRQSELQAIEFADCSPLPGVPALLKKLSDATVANNTSRNGSIVDSERSSRVMSPTALGGPRKVRLALATSSHARNFELKTRKIKPLFSVFPQDHVVLGDDERIPKGRGKPLPDIYLLALQCINETIEREAEGERPVKPEECLVFEDSVPGIESGRRAGMRVVWVPHEGLLGVYKDRIEEVLAARTGEHKEGDLVHQGSVPLAGSPGQVGELNDGWGEMLSSLENFDYAQYGMDVTSTRFRSESGQPAQKGTTDRELEEMTALADGKLHAQEEGFRNPTPIPGLSELNPKV